MLFAAVGAVGTAAHFLTLIALVQFWHSPPVLASAAGCVIGALVNYWLNYTITFKSRNPHRIAIVKFFSIALAGLCINTLIMTIATKWIHYLLSQVVATCLVLFWNYLCNRFWTFKEAPHAKE
jgi:putative flippase GtrA